MILLGPYNIIEDINYSGWKNLQETFENKIVLQSIKQPDIISGTIKIEDKEYPIVYNAIEMNHFECEIFNYRVIYIPKEGYLTNIFLYIKTNTITKLDNNKIFFTKKKIRKENTYDTFEANITLELNEELIKKFLFTH
jgi:hypothetical protein